MTEPGEPLGPAELRVRDLLRDLGDERAPDGEELARRVVRSARWQRGLRRVLVGAGGTLGAVVDGVGLLVRGSRR